MNYLALDVATHTGFARWSPGMEWPEYGSEKFLAPELCDRAVQFADWVMPMIAAHKITDVAIEAPVPQTRGHTNLNSLIWLYGCYWRLTEICARRKITLLPVGVAQWRSLFLGVTFAPKGIEPSKRSIWLKRRCVDECRARGYAPKNDNDGDAIGILEYLRCMNDAEFARQSRPQLLKEAA